MVQAPVYLLNESLIRRRAAERNLFLVEVADQAGVARAHFSRLLTGHERPSPLTRRKLLGAPLFSDFCFDDLFIECPSDQSVRSREAKPATPRTTKPGLSPVMPTT